MPWHSSGTVALTANSATVTGTGTAFSASARTGDAFRGPDGRWYEITNIASATVLSIKPNYQGATASGQAYAIAPMQGYVKESADRLRQLVDQYGSQLAALQPWATSATPAAARTALGAAPLASPELTGNPTAPTPAADDSDTSIATTAFVRAAMALFGVGTKNLPSNNDLDALDTACMHKFDVPTTGSPGFNYGVVLVLPRFAFEVVQIAWSITTDIQVSRRLSGGTWSPWRRIYHTGNILGTVSQSGGVPTGAAFQFTETAAGQTWRNAAGLQICTNSNNPITTDPAAFVGTPTTLDGGKMKIGRWF